MYAKCSAVHYGWTFSLIWPKDIVTIVFCKPELCCHIIFQEKRLCPGILPNKPYLFSLFLMRRSCTSAVNMLTEACWVWDFLQLLCALHNPTLGWICWDVLSLEDCVIVLTYIWMVQTSKITKTLTEVLTRTDDRLIECIWLALSCYLRFIFLWKQWGRT